MDALSLLMTRFSRFERGDHPDPIGPESEKVWKNLIFPIGIIPAHEDGRIGEALGRNLQN